MALARPALQGARMADGRTAVAHVYSHCSVLVGPSSGVPRTGNANRHRRLLQGLSKGVV